MANPRNPPFAESDTALSAAGSHEPGPASGSSQHRAARRALELIEAIAASDRPLTLSELATNAGVPKSTAHQLLHTLQAEGFLSRSEEGFRYSLGPRLLRLLGNLPSQFELPRVARPIMENIVGEVGETCVLGVRHRDQIMYVEQVEADQFMRYAAPLGSPRPLYCTSIGKIFMAGMTDDELLAVLQSIELEALTVYTKTLIEDIVIDAHTVRAQGYSISREESILGVTAVASAVRGQSKPGVVLAGLAITGPSDRMAPKLQRAQKLVVGGADQIAMAVKSR